MERWLKEVVLETDNVRLAPLREHHREDLLRAAADGDLSGLWYTSVPSENNIGPYMEKAIGDFNEDKGLAFVVMDKRTDMVVGTTRYTNAIPEHRRLDIGFTWYAKSFQRTHVNSECKLLLLTHAFEILKAIAVEFRTNWYNFPSREAIARLGAKQDGVLRNHQIMPDGTLRDTVIFSIIESEWRTCKRSLEHKIGQAHKRKEQGPGK